ncbi:membrane hypothetical protein [Flavobacterium psychrophilum]|nr:membrane hypothetical protein [Flavobacterium psychrophilum]
MIKVNLASIKVNYIFNIVVSALTKVNLVFIKVNYIFTVVIFVLTKVNLVLIIVIYEFQKSEKNKEKQNRVVALFCFILFLFFYV